jgi:glycyl-tRNA synthetase beta chain
MADFLLEIGTEEIPARMIEGAQAELARRVGDLLARERLVEAADVIPYSTPRRIAVLARGVRAAQADVTEELHGPAVSVAARNPKAAEAFARKAGVDVAKLEKVTTPKGEYLSAHVVRSGRKAAEILGEALPREIAGIYWAKSMYWRTKSERFVRPLRWLVALLDDEAVPLEFGGIKASGDSRGHRLLATGPVRIGRAADYQPALAAAHVLMQAERRHTIRKALDAATRTVPGARWREDAELLDTVVNLTEFPSAILGRFEPEFLALPEEVLVTVMRDHQKYFAVEDAAGKLAPYFLAVLNTSGDPDGLIVHGNERVLRARFRDARFFWDTDQKTTLAQRVPMLKSVTFQKDLGSYYAKTERVKQVAEALAARLAEQGVSVSDEVVRQAAQLAKTDLTAELVKEFTELQGVIGGLYAVAQGLGPAVGEAIYDQYLPTSMESAVPRTVEGAVLAIADKADSIVGMFGLGLAPTGSKDPFALRRQANGIVKIIAEHRLPLSLADVIASAGAAYEGTEAAKKSTVSHGEVAVEVFEFFRERLEFYLRDVLGYSYDVVNAVLAAGADDVVNAIARAAAVAQARTSEDFAAISVAFKRTKNILRQAAEAGKWQAKKAAAGFGSSEQYADAAERQLAGRSAEVAGAVTKLREAGHYEAALTEISRLRPEVDAFFDKVMVMVDDETVRTRRLALLQTLLNEFSTIADFSEIVTGK